jgi:hypothetical protein
MVKRLVFKLVGAFVGVMVLLGIFLIIGYMATDHKDYPGKSEFEQADHLIDTNSRGAAHGNSDKAKEAASQFATMIKPLQAALFTGGSGRSIMSGGEFVTYCRHNADSVAFIVHVPELRNYKDQKAREALAALAWTTANRAAQGLTFSSTNPAVIVGLRGFASYGPIWSGKLNGAADAKTDELDEKRRIYPFFASVDQGKPTTAPADQSHVTK